MNEKLGLIKIELEKLFDKVTIENDSSPEIRFIFEQNGHTVRRNFLKRMYEKAITDCESKQFAFQLSIDVMDAFLMKD